MRRGAALALGSLLLAGCAGEEGGETHPSSKSGVAASAAGGISFPPARGIRVPAGFRAEIYARGLTRPTAMAWGPNGRLYVTEEIGRVVAVAPLSRRPRVLARGFPTPLGLAWQGRTLFVSAQGRVDRMQLREGRIAGRRRIVTGLPFGLHQQDNVVAGRDGRLYLGSGSTCNACVEADRRSAAILSVRPDGRGLRVVARGLRNPFGLALHPVSGRLYVSVNGRDDLPDAAAPEPAEMLVRITPGARYGWPDCWPSWRRKRMVGACRGVSRPLAYLEPHSSADGIAFTTGPTFPARYRGGVFVALWGQYNARRYGRRVDFVALPSGRVSRFATGFDHPLAVAFDAHGALLVADWGRGTIYRIQRRGRP
jgi:glucose/arabinose dehydrogenase